MSSNSLGNLLETSMAKIKEMVDVDTIIGKPINCPDSTIIIPVSKVAYGFGSGGSDLPSKNDKEGFGGGAGAGISITPIAFIVIANGDAKLLQIPTNDNTADRVVNMVPDVVDKISGIFKKDKRDKKDKDTTTEV